MGGAPNKFVAKVACAHAKPDGILMIAADAVVQFLHPLPVGALWGVGTNDRRATAHLGVRSVGDVAHLPRQTLHRAFGPAMGEHLADLSWGQDERTVTNHTPERSIGSEHTFGGDVDDPEVITRQLLRLSDHVAARLRAAGQVGRTVSIKIRFADFTTITRSKTLPEATDIGRDIYAVAIGLYQKLGLQRARLRLVGVRMEKLADSSEATHQLGFDDPEHGWREAETAVDRATAKYGSGVITPASLLDRRRSRGRGAPP